MPCAACVMLRASGRYRLRGRGRERLFAQGWTLEHGVSVPYNTPLAFRGCAGAP